MVTPASQGWPETGDLRTSEPPGRTSSVFGVKGDGVHDSCLDLLKRTVLLCLAFCQEAEWPGELWENVGWHGHGTNRQ